MWEWDWGKGCGGERVEQRNEEGVDEEGDGVGMNGGEEDWLQCGWGDGGMGEENG